MFNKLANVFSGQKEKLTNNITASDRPKPIFSMYDSQALLQFKGWPEWIDGDPIKAKNTNWVAEQIRKGLLPDFPDRYRWTADPSGRILSGDWEYVYFLNRDAKTKMKVTMGNKVQHLIAKTSIRDEL